MYRVLRLSQSRKFSKKATRQIANVHIHRNFGYEFLFDIIFERSPNLRGPIFG